MEHLENGNIMKITDMNFDCLEGCFMHLNMEELLNVADLHNVLKCAARYVFARLYGRKMVSLSVLKSPKQEPLFLPEEKLRINDLKMGLQFLRCFGDLVSGVNVFFRHNFYHLLCNSALRSRLSESQIDGLIQSSKAYEYDHLIIDYINEYCSQSLTKIEFQGNVMGNLNKLTKPFHKVKQVRIDTVFPTEKKLCELFPKVRELELYCELCIDYCRKDIFLQNEFIAEHCPYLEHLLIKVYITYEFNNENVAIALRLNPQLKSLKGDIWLDVIFDTDIFWNANEYLQNLERLDLVVNNNDHLKKTIGKNIHLKNLKELFFECLVPAEPCTIPFSSDKLESLTLYFSFVTVEDFDNIIDKYPTLKKLDIATEGYLTNYVPRNLCEINYLRISKTLPLLEEIYLDYCDNYYGFDYFLTFDTVVLVINEFRSLRFFSSLLFEIDRLKRLLNGWSVSSATSENRLKIILKRQN